MNSAEKTSASSHAKYSTLTLDEKVFKAKKYPPIIETVTSASN